MCAVICAFLLALLYALMNADYICKMLMSYKCNPISSIGVGAFMKPEISLSDSEWELMKALWLKAPASVNELCERIKTTKDWHPKTVRTMLLRLFKKGIIRQEIHDGVIHYAPVYSREYCESTAAESFLSRVFDGALSPMLARFAQTRPLTESDRKALRAMLDEDDTNKGS